MFDFLDKYAEVMGDNAKDQELHGSHATHEDDLSGITRNGVTNGPHDDGKDDEANGEKGEGGAGDETEVEGKRRVGEEVLEGKDDKLRETVFATAVKTRGGFEGNDLGVKA